MPPPISVIEGPYLADLLFQPQALADTLAGLTPLPSLAPEKFRRIVLTGMGGSLHTLHPLSLQLIGHGFTSLVAETSELVYSMSGLLGSGTLLVALSQSGRSAETVRLLEGCGRGVTTIGITNTAGSPLAERADVTVLTRAGPEASVSSKTVLAALLALAWLGDCLCGKDLARTARELAEAAPAAGSYLARWREHVASLCGELAGVRDVFLVGRGASLAAAGVGGLIIKESTHVHSEGMSSAAFRHGPFEMLSPEVFVLVLEGDPATAPLNRALVGDIRNAGGRAALAGPGAELDVFRLPEVPPAVRPILEMLPVEMISLALAALAGREAGRFERIAKVTTTE
ncbi:MAG: SIS domain-containing protein [Acidobacteria bacterium]|nr:SIS domain-containing protein [Acidobacteriota bacterium]